MIIGLSFNKDNSTKKKIMEGTQVKHAEQRGLINSGNKRAAAPVESSAQNTASHASPRKAGASLSPSATKMKTIEFSAKYLSNVNPVYPKIMEKHSLKLTEARLNNWRDTMKIIVDCKNGRLPEEAFEDRLPGYLCRQ